MRAPMATSAASPLVLGLPEKKAHNVYQEPNPGDPNRPYVLVEAPGSLQRHAFADACRGMWQADGHADGKVLIAQGTTLSTYDPATDTAGALTGTIAGSDFGDFAFTESEGFGLFNGGLYVSDGTAIAAVSDGDFATLLSDAGATEFSSLATLGQRGLFTFKNRFGFTDVLDMDSTSALSYYTPESSPDAIVAGRVVGEFYYIFGTQTIEVWAQTGDADDPFSLQDGLTQQVGCLCRDGIVRADNTLFFIDDGCNPRRLGQGGSQIINPNDPWVADILKAAGAANIRGKIYSDKTHEFVAWRTPNGEVVHDILTSQWHTRGTNQTPTSRYTAMVQAGTRVFVCDDDGQFDELSRDYASESMPNASTMGTEIAREFTAYLSNVPKRKAIKTVRVEVAMGVGLSAGQGANPVIQMRQSFDGGNTWTSWNSKPLGAQGEYGKRGPTWRRRGRVKDKGVVFHFLKTDPVKEAYLGVPVNEDQAA